MKVCKLLFIKVPNFFKVVATNRDLLFQGEVDALDGQGNTALQIVCGSHPTENTVALVELLLKTGVSYSELYIFTTNLGK